jgi:hypothetical protein
MKYLNDYRLLHQANAFGGMTLARFAEPVLKLISFNACQSVLDYGSGKGQSWEHEEGLKKCKASLPVTLYDPGVPEHEQKPAGKFGAVLCMDVMEHIPEDEIVDTLNEVFDYSEGIVIATFCARGSRKKLPSTGQDVHVTQRQRLWWEQHMHMANIGKSRPVKWYLFENV